MIGAPDYIDHAVAVGDYVPTVQAEAALLATIRAFEKAGALRSKEESCVHPRWAIHLRDPRRP
jgi:hypothetical protein